MLSLPASGATRGPYSKAPLAVTAAIAIAIVTVHAFLVPLGNWRYDEFDTFRYIREGGLSFVWGRITGWSPRPLSEILIYGYGSLVEATGRPHVGLFLGALWLLLITAIFGPVLVVAKDRRHLRVPTATIGSVVLALFLVGHRMDEVFLWTQGAAAYMTTLAAIAFVMMLHLCVEKTSPKVMCISSFAATAAALSSEMGASFAIAYGGCIFLASLVGSSGPTLIANLRRSMLESALPILSGLTVFYFVANGRMTISKEVVGNSEVARHLLPSFWAAVNFMPSELFSLGSTASRGFQLALGGVVAAALCLGALFLFAAFGMAKDRWTSYRLLAVGAASLAAVFISLLAAYYQFGLVCCSRHETMRRCLAILSVVCFMSAIYSLLADRFGAWTGNGAVATAASSFLSVAMATSFVVSFRPLISDFKNYEALSTLIHENWESGISAGPSMNYRPSISEIVCSPGSLAPGAYRLNENMPAQVGYIARYFRKTEVVITGEEPPCKPL